MVSRKIELQVKKGNITLTRFHRNYIFNIYYIVELVFKFKYNNFQRRGDILVWKLKISISIPARPKIDFILFFFFHDMCLIRIVAFHNFLFLFRAALTIFIFSHLLLLPFIYTNSQQVDLLLFLSITFNFDGFCECQISPNVSS